jgi:tRNA 2-thiouridine synthesizing protein D
VFLFSSMTNQSSFTLLVSKAPFDRQEPYSAYRFAKAALLAGHQIKGVFFYQSGVANSNNLQAGHSDELNMYQLWCELAAHYQVPLQVCVTAANRRGVINDEDAQDRDLIHFNLAAPFSEVGLGDLIELISSSDRVLQF